MKQRQNHSGGTKLTRRALVGGAAAGTLALTSGYASAQRCPATPPAHTKGPAVWLDYDQQDMDELYDQGVFAFNQRHVLARSDANNAIATAVIGKPERFAYGSDPVEGVDVWRTRKPNPPVLIYLHGGSWQSGRSADFALYAEPYINAGAHFVSVDFTNVRATKGDLFPLVDQCRRAVAWTYRNAAKFAGDPERLYLCSRSSGSHLAGCVVTTDWEAMGLPRTILKGAVMGSGMYDLKPVRLSARSKFVAFTDEMEQQLSAQRHIDKLHTSLVLCIGTLETPEFQRQSRDFVAAVKAAGKPAELVVGQHYNHFEVGDTIGHPYQLIGRELMKMMQLSMS
jgi:arylformamidase